MQQAPGAPRRHQQARPAARTDRAQEEAPVRERLQLQKGAEAVEVHQVVLWGQEDAEGGGAVRADVWSKEHRGSFKQW